MPLPITILTETITSTVTRQILSLTNRARQWKTHLVNDIKDRVIESLEADVQVKNNIEPQIHYAKITIPRIFVQPNSSEKLTFTLEHLDQRCGVVLMPCNQVGISRIHHHHYVNEHNELTVVFTNTSNWMESPGLSVGEWLVIIFKLPEEVAL